MRRRAVADLWSQQIQAAQAAGYKTIRSWTRALWREAALARQRDDPRWRLRTRFRGAKDLVLEEPGLESRRTVALRVIRDSIVFVGGRRPTRAVFLSEVKRRVYAEELPEMTLLARRFIRSNPRLFR